MTSRPDDPFVIPADELEPATATPADAPPPPDEEPPQGEAMLQVTRLAARRRRGSLFWTVLGTLALAGHLGRRLRLPHPPPRPLPAPRHGRAGPDRLLALIVLAQLVRELWAFRRLARIDGFRAEAAAVHATRRPRRGAARSPSASPASTAAATSCAGAASASREQRDGLLDADALVELTERALLRPPRRRGPPRDRGGEPRRRRRHRASSRSRSSTCWRRSRRTSGWSAASPRSTARTPASSAPGGCSRSVATHLLATGLVSVGDDLSARSPAATCSPASPAASARAW